MGEGMMEPVYLEVKTITTLVDKSHELIEDREAALDAMAPVREMMAEHLAKAIDFRFMAMLRQRNPQRSPTDSSRPPFTDRSTMC